MRRADAAQLPFFVYGTLRKGMGNDDAIQWAAEETITPAWLPGFRLYVSGPPYVGFAPYGAGFVHGEVVRVREADYEDVFTILDGIEGFFPDTFTSYIRAALPVWTPAGVIAAWVYMGGPMFGFNKAGIVESGDYVAFRREEDRRYAQIAKEGREARERAGA